MGSTSVPLQKTAQGASAWTWNAERGEFFLSMNSAAEPDLNLKNPAVVEELKKVLRFWLDLGVDGFHIESAGQLIEGIFNAHIHFRNMIMHNSRISLSDALKTMNHYQCIF